MGFCDRWIQICKIGAWLTLILKPMGFGDSRILRDTHVYIFIYIYTHLSTSNIYSSSFFDNIYISRGKLSQWLTILGQKFGNQDNQSTAVPNRSWKSVCGLFFCDLVEDLVNPNCQKDVIPKNDGKMTMICFPIKKPTWGQCDWNWFFIAISAQWLCDIIYIYIHIYLHTHHIYIYLNTDYIHQDSRVNPI